MSEEELRNILRDIPEDESPLLTRDELLDLIRTIDDLSAENARLKSESNDAMLDNALEDEENAKNAELVRLLEAMPPNWYVYKTISGEYHVMHSTDGYAHTSFLKPTLLAALRAARDANWGREK